ncbi:ATP-binding cassette [Lithospermum erythrorhizon]|uniref:ATP-binding cassette n=1 Tax=Lithospermum erythrorhizon TaxID=34254 RepID=A0AAV3QNU4_LITER
MFDNYTIHNISALLRLPDAKKKATTTVQALLKELGLEHVAESRVGQGSNHGISGGERRRVSIGAELVHDPPVILIDEPTSGLDSASAFHIISTLKLMTLNKGKTIVLTIHQPGFRILVIKCDCCVGMSLILYMLMITLIEKFCCKGHNFVSWSINFLIDILVLMLTRPSSSTNLQL